PEMLAGFDQNSASIGATVTRSFTASASCRSSVIKASAWSWVRATYSASNVRPPELVGDLPCDDLKLVVFEQPDPHPARVEEAPLGILLGHLTAVYRLVEERQQLRAKKRRSQHVMPVGN